MLGDSNNNDDDGDYYCSSIFPPSRIPGTHIDSLGLVGGILYAFATICTLAFIRYAQRAATSSQETLFDKDIAVKSVIFPTFVKVLWIQAAVSAFTAVVIVFVPIDLGGQNRDAVALVFGATWLVNQSVNQLVNQLYFII